MKMLTSFIFFLLLPKLFFAQDLIVKSTGEKINCKIVSVDSTLVTYANTDTTKKEISILQKQDVLALRKNTEKPILFFVPDTLYKTNGTRISCRVIEIDPATISYLTVDSLVGDLQMSSNDNLIMIHFGNGSSEVIEHKIETSNAATISNMDYYKMGEADAAKYYKTSGVVAGEVFCGLGTYVIGIGIVAGIVVYAVPPKQLNNYANPNNHLLNENPNYLIGYKDGATRKKHKSAAIGYACGALAPVAIIVVGLSILSQRYN